MNFLTSPWFAGIASGIAVTIINFLVSRKKTIAEIKKLEAENEKIRLETKKIRKDLNINAENVESLRYQSAIEKEQILYDSKNRSDIGFDFKGNGNIIYQRDKDGQDVAVTGRGLGFLKFEKNIINLERTNINGRFEIWLQTYILENIEKQFIPKDDLIDGNKKIRISFEAKVTKGSHTLNFVFKGQETQDWLGHGERTFSEDAWTPTTLYFSVVPRENIKLRIDDQDVSHSPSSIQIRNFVLAEKITT
jgi:hypothetical protein